MIVCNGLTVISEKKKIYHECIYFFCFIYNCYIRSYTIQVMNLEKCVKKHQHFSQILTEIYCCLQFLGISDCWKSLREVKKELGMELLVMEWMMRMIYLCSPGLELLLVLQTQVPKFFIFIFMVFFCDFVFFAAFFLKLFTYLI